MVSQGLLGALAQFWTIEKQPRLHRKNTYFQDHQVSNKDALLFGLSVTVLALAIGVSWCVVGVII